MLESTLTNETLDKASGLKINKYPNNLFSVFIKLWVSSLALINQKVVTKIDTEKGDSFHNIFQGSFMKRY